MMEKVIKAELSEAVKSGVCAETLRTSPKYRTHFRKIKNIGNHIQFYTDVSITPDLPEPPRNSSEKQEAGFSTEP